MPAATTHAEFAKDVLNSLSEEDRKKITDLPMYYLGSQGPDLLFFSRFMVLPGSLNKYGVLMHKEKVGEVIRYFDRNCVTPALRSYFYGYLTHYALDSMCHGIINACAKKEHEQLGTHEEEAHFRIEGELDAWTMRRLGKTVFDYDVYKMLKVNRQDAHELGLLYHNMFESVFGIDLPVSRFEETCQDCADITRYLRPGKKRFFLIGSAESLFRIPKLVTGMMLYDKEGATPSVINSEHKPWNWYGESKDSYPQLYEKAKTLALNLFHERASRYIRKTFTGIPLGETIL